MLLIGDHQGTRNRVRELISADGPLTAAAIASRLSLTPAAVRRHLEALAGEGAITQHHETRRDRPRGRPARAYVLSQAGHQRLGSAYDDVATAALGYLAERAGPQAVADFAASQMQAVERRYAVRLDGVTGSAKRAEALSVALTADGYAASVRSLTTGTSSAGVQLCQGHCPVQHVAERFPQLCDAETDVFSRLLGVRVQRLATLAHGEHVCTTFVPAVPDAVPAARSAEVPAPRGSGTHNDAGTDARKPARPAAKPPTDERDSR